MMKNPTEWFQNKTIELEDDSKRKGALQDMKSAVLNAEKTVLQEVARNVSVKPIFECLSSSDSQDTEVICVIIVEILSQMSGTELLESYGDSIQSSLSHPSDEVKGVVLKLLEKTINENTIKVLLEKYKSLLVEAAACLAASERSAAQGAIMMFIKIGSSHEGHKVLYSTPVLNKLKEVMTVNDTSKFRVYEIMVAISNQSAENLSASVSCGLMESFISEISSDSILIQLNAIEMLSTLGSSNHGLNYLHESKVIQRILDKLLQITAEPDLLFQGYIDFFGNICSLHPEHFAKEYPKVIPSLLGNVSNANDEVLGGIVGAIGKIGSTCTGRKVINECEGPLKEFFEKVGQILTKKSDLTVTTLYSLCELMKKLDGDDKVNEISKEWFQLIKPNALESIVNLSKLPFVEFRLAAFTLLKTISTMQWGTEMVINYPGMIEFLLDRSTEFNKDCKQTKFEIVYNQVQCINLEHLVTPEVLNSLKEFVKEGPFYVPTYVELATERAS